MALPTPQDLQQAYNRQNWLDWLKDIFGSQMQIETQVEKVEIDKNDIKSIERFASVELADGKKLAVLDIETRKGIQITRNRVGLSNLVNKFIDPASYYGILAFYHSEDAAQSEYRMSFISSELKINKDGTFTLEKTAPKRYTYVLDKDEKTKTPADRLKTIAAKNGKTTLEDVKNAFSVETLTKVFYNELFDWYRWALSEEIGVTFPNDRSTEADDRQIEEHIIRLITRLMFVWFIKQKQLIPEKIFNTNELKTILKNFDATDNKQDNYYRAILQNLFFATLNNRIEDRAFAVEGTFYENKAQYGIKTLYRYADEFSISTEEIVKLFGKVPFLNGGLFECLDKDTPDSNGKIIYYDGFSRKNNRQSRAHIPNILFFDKDKGIIPLLGKYNFTIEENSPNDVEVALDPELLGKVFENLLGTYNPETKETARKQSGSFYTPREIVNYMVDESLIAYLKQAVGEQHEEVLRKLFYEKIELDAKLKKQIYEALLNGKILDPACGSGAFPMGILNRIICVMENIDYSDSIFDLKLHLIENCIYGVDIQPIAIQISKLRFFISLICEQVPNIEADNFGIKSLPNLETKFVAANTLIGLAKKEAGNLFENPQIEVTKKSLLEIRHLHFGADTAKKKKEYRTKDKELREKLANLLEVNNDFAPEYAKQLALWNPYDQNASSPFFDMEWMFGIKDGFDIVIGNPPYVQLQNSGGKLAKLYEKANFKTFAKTGDIYCLFYEKGYQLLKQNGHLSFITSNKWMRAGYGEKTRKFFVEEANPVLLIDFAGVKVFDEATVDVNILMFSKDKNRQKTNACIIKNNNINNLSDYFMQNSTVCNFKANDSWVILSSIEQNIKSKIEAVGTPLKEWDIQINYGIKTGFNDAFIITGDKRKELIEQDSKSDEIIRPILRGRDIKRYGYEFADLYLLFIPWHFPLQNDTTIQGASKKAEQVFKEQYPAIYNHLLKYKEELSNRNKAETGIRYEWYALQRWGANYWEDFSKQKIVWSDISIEPSFVYLEKPIFFNNTCYIMTNAPVAILGILNSKVIKWYFPKIATDLGKGARYFKQFVELLPIPNIPLEQQHPITTLVNKILEKKKENSAVDTIDLERQIDLLVYELYGLSEEEIKVVEG